MPESFLDFVKGLEGRDNVRTLSTAELEKNTRPYGRVTASESISFFSDVRNRSAGVSVVVGSERVQQQVLSDRQKSILERMDRTIEEVKSYLHYAPLICIKRTIGDNDSFQPRCTLYLSTQRADNIRQAYIWANTLQEYLPNAAGRSCIWSVSPNGRRTSVRS